jgi:hypothetical protein
MRPHSGETSDNQSGYEDNPSRYNKKNTRRRRGKGK